MRSCFPADQRQRLARDGYLVGGNAAGPEPSVVPMTLFGAGLVTYALLALISPDGADAPSSYVVDGCFGDAHMAPATEPEPDCWCRQIAWRGDDAALSFLPEP